METDRSTGEWSKERAQLSEVVQQQNLTNPATAKSETGSEEDTATEAAVEVTQKKPPRAANWMSYRTNLASAE